MKNKYKKIITIMTLLLILLNWSYRPLAMQLDNEVKIATGKYYVGEVSYENFIIRAKRISDEKTKAIGYCLEIDKSYPSGEIFKENGYATKQLAGILSAGYPSKSYTELNVFSEEEAYFATQIAVWSFIEGYDVNEFRGSSRIKEAIKKIYNDGINADDQSYSNKYKIYHYNNNIQDVVLLSISDSDLTEENKTNTNEIIPGK